MFSKNVAFPQCRIELGTFGVEVSCTTSNWAKTFSVMAVLAYTIGFNALVWMNIGAFDL